MRIDQKHAALMVAGAVVAADQLTKAIAFPKPGGPVIPVSNPDATLGLVSGPTIFLSLLSVVGLATYGRHALRQAERGGVTMWSSGLMVGGAASNLADRVVFGAVRDFLATPWMIVNVADVAVLTGVIAFVGAGVSLKRRRRGEHSGARSLPVGGHELLRAERSVDGGHQDGITSAGLSAGRTRPLGNRRAVTVAMRPCPRWTVAGGRRRESL